MDNKAIDSFRVSLGVALKNIHTRWYQGHTYDLDSETIKIGSCIIMYKKINSIFSEIRIINDSKIPIDIKSINSCIDFSNRLISSSYRAFLHFHKNKWISKNGPHSLSTLKLSRIISDNEYVFKYKNRTEYKLKNDINISPYWNPVMIDYWMWNNPIYLDYLNEEVQRKIENLTLVIKKEEEYISNLSIDDEDYDFVTLCLKCEKEKLLNLIIKGSVKTKPNFKFFLDFDKDKEHTIETHGYTMKI